MRAGIDLESIWNAVTVEVVMQLLGVDAQYVLIAHVDGDGFVLLQVADVLVDKSQRSVGRPLGDYVLLNLPSLVAISRYSGGGKIIASPSTVNRFSSLRCTSP